MTKKQIRQDVEDLFADFDVVKWTVATREMALRIAHGNYDSARSVLNAFCMGWKRDYATMQSSVSNVFPVRVATMLESHGYMTIESVSKASEFDLLSIQNFGETFVDLVRNVVSSVRSGNCPNISQDEFIEIADMDLLPDQELIRSKATKASSEVSEKLSISAIVNAIASDREAIVKELERQIAEHQKEVDRLKAIHSTLCGVERKYRPIKIKNEIEDKIVDFVKQNPGKSCVAIAEETGLHRTLVGRYVRSSSRLTKTGGKVRLA